MDNTDIANAVKQLVDELGLKYSYLSRQTNIEYQRLMRIFNQGAVMSGTELLRICAVINVEPMTLVNRRPA